MLQDDDARITFGAIDEVNLPFVAKAITNVYLLVRFLGMAKSRTSMSVIPCA